ncbi:hypothetical protein ALT_0282 [Aspergillus lentulus]|uniref:Uncharacterized protein n=1 Tax=Aspergillus lentulus TaxID=293939 RepID=A0AAN4PBP7_ASPLE|nr:uncharacterized protein IFM58399_05884 [Aspergillus lentulus]KAF4156811.1 hypothetical protein CNMCM6069_006333 [Aspergillus lentulus]KAF4169471.1 hypothetical protein CNMCM6936_008163 [Aspergillus lentulus]KAF4176138.1 hypothetical protein CNMCM8060_006555 [Aspergillus lentulus]KAF4181667.1 hypothetical protein CNMCM7927_000546 [Aspergillus lentulus]KAF4198708.1 hypothetical protein CNMCM8694_008754 [Aspergillus lentulus]
MAANNPNVTRATKDQYTVVHWMINDPKGGFQEHTLGSKGGPPQFVSISKSDIAKNPQLKALDEKTLKTATIDRQGVINVDIGGKEVPFVNVQAQIGEKPNRHTYSHVNVVADRKVGTELIRKAMNESLDSADSRWIVEASSNKYVIQATRPA